MKLNQSVELKMKQDVGIFWRNVQQEPSPRPEASYAPIPGGALTYTKNLHLPFEKAPGHVEEVTLVEGQTTHPG